MPQIVDSLSAEMYLLIMPVKMINGKCLEKTWLQQKMHCGKVNWTGFVCKQNGDFQ